MILILGCLVEFTTNLSMLLKRPILAIKELSGYFIGIILGVVSTTYFILSCLKKYPILTASFFVGLIIGTIPIVQFDCPEGLEQGHNNKMVTTEESGNPFIVKADQNIKQYAIEVSNTNIYDELNDLMRLNTSMIASLNLMKVADDMYNKSINITE